MHHENHFSIHNTSFSIGELLSFTMIEVLKHQFSFIASQTSHKKFCFFEKEKRIIGNLTSSRRFNWTHWLKREGEVRTEWNEILLISFSVNNYSQWNIIERSSIVSIYPRLSTRRITICDRKRISFLRQFKWLIEHNGYSMNISFDEQHQSNSSDKSIR